MLNMILNTIYLTKCYMFKYKILFCPFDYKAHNRNYCIGNTYITLF